MPEAHSKWSASNFKKIMLCPGSVVLEEGKPNPSSKYSAEGTAAHDLLDRCLKGGLMASNFKGWVIEADGYQFTVDDDMVDHIQWCIDHVNAVLATEGGTLLSEQRLNYSHYLGQPKDDAWGTGDILILRDGIIDVMDLKYGRGVEVDAEGNPQMRLYALGAVAEHQGLSCDITGVRMTILQPRITRTPSVWEEPLESLEGWGYSTARSAVNTCINAADLGSRSPGWYGTFLRPGEEQCRFCRAKASCPKLSDEVSFIASDGYNSNRRMVMDGDAETVDDFSNLTLAVPTTLAEANLAAAMAATGMIEDWITGVRAEVERRLLAGQLVTGFKLVQGRQGNRAWTSETEAEAAMKAMRLKQDEMYKLSIISPTAAEKLLAEAPRRWAKLKELITRSEGKPSVAPATDKRPALEVKPAADDFEVLPDPENLDDLS